MIVFNRWPPALARRYREKGYWIDLPLTDILTRHAGRSETAILCNEQALSYRQLNDAALRLAAALARRGVRRGQTALVQLGNEAEFYIVFFALLHLGVAPVNALFSHQRSELVAYADQIAPALLIADRRHRLFADDGFIEALRARCPTLQTVLLHQAAPADRLDLSQLLQEEAGDFTPTPTPADEVAFFQLSGGSTGTPKLIPRTHNDYYYSVRASNPLCGVSAHTRSLCALPAAHNYPLSSPGALGVFYAGGMVALAPDPSPDSCFPLISRHRLNHVALVPPAVSVWLEAVRLAGNAEALSSLTLLQVGGARIEPSLARRIPAELGCQLQQVFGMAEGLVNYTRLDDDDLHRFTTQGKPISEDDEVWVADADGNPLPAGKPGLLMTRGPYTFRGYYRSPQHNRAVFNNDGFYCSGDVVIQLADGYLQVVGREKDQINRGGEKVAAEEIEHLLLRHPAVLHAALVAAPDAMMGEKSCAFIVSREAVKAVTLRRYLRDLGIADYKLPDRFIFLSTLPLTPVGKINKQRLRALAAAAGEGGLS
ncbi:(2,3-dihydroxybenzoyl)adenylate synthase [Mixta tenebrionis]|uniref:(2,3-dihydroxybenzoyl)adenylate synthase n=1 Tax=Mixta tenebrionis TaxID=2562439 RepID=A0A506VCZ2_9GAMM|nr:(2,3-dihydroxybenzoyl)adenylate synthase [Mixta tenebrionis]TPW42863.1 (2,3-dihydroxybenzoyl)adenylate synthase [Mixta tenebrionis]